MGVRIDRVLPLPPLEADAGGIPPAPYPKLASGQQEGEGHPA